MKKQYRQFKRNRELTDSDISGADTIFITIVTDESYPFFLSIDKDKVAGIDNDNTRRITNWCFLVNGIRENDNRTEWELYDLEKFDGIIEEYSIIIGKID